MKIVPFANPELVDEIGDIIVDEPLDESWFKPISENLFNSFKVMPIPTTFGHKWDMLARLGVENVEEIEKALEYECHWTENKYFMFMPGFILYNNREPWDTENNKPVWNSYVGADFYFDDEWQKQCFRSGQQHEKSNWKNHFLVPLDDISESMLGHGYTYGTLPDDGGNELIPAVMQLDNGDLLLGKVWVWYNK